MRQHGGGELSRQATGSIVWINRRGVALHASVPKPDFEFREVGGAARDGGGLGSRFGREHIRYGDLDAGRIELE